ncbi:glycine receptor subunit alpha-2-like isoform X2 [Amphiura filiformis]|uniref:glycine receptor subunit alpha-2-like isoform X2 n=1 Tax=Amphiura filiformis TaxID=82378 RepID=UPI003B20BC61
MSQCGNKLFIPIMGINLVMVVSLLKWATASENVSSILQSIVSGQKYDFRIRPDIDGPATKVILGLIVESLGPFQESTMDLSVTFYLHMTWFDARLKFNEHKHITFKAHDETQIWLPDIYFLYEKRSHHHHMTQANQAMRVWPNGTARLSTRISLTVSCTMILDRFPMDSQECAVHMMSYAYPMTELWPELDENHIVLPDTIKVSKFDVLNYNTGAYNETYDIGDWRGVFIKFNFKRQVQTYILTVYVPSLLLILMSWISFWIDAQAAPARVSVGVTAVLTATTMTASMQDTFPVATTAKANLLYSPDFITPMSSDTPSPTAICDSVCAVDVWLAVCLIFVFLSLMEYALANYLIVLQERKMVKALTAQGGTMPAEAEILPPGTTLRSLASTKYARNVRASIKSRNRNAGPSTTYNQNSTRRHHETFIARHLSHLTADKLDRFARVIFAIAFIIFNTIYWSWYLT